MSYTVDCVRVLAWLVLTLSLYVNAGSIVRCGDCRHSEMDDWRTPQSEKKMKSGCMSKDEHTKVTVLSLVLLFYFPVAKVFMELQAFLIYATTVNILC